MSFFYIRAWVDGSDVVAVRTGEGPITSTGNYGNATIIDAVGEGDYVDAGTILSTLAYANNALSSSLVTIYPAKDVTSLFANAGYTGQAVYNWTDANLYQWNGNPWDSSSIGIGAVRGIADQSFTDNIADAIIPYDNFAQDVKDLFDDIAENLGQLTDDTVVLKADVTTLQTSYTSLDGTVTANVTAISGLETRVTNAEGAITSSASDITQLQTDLTNAQTGISGNATAISGLDTRVTSNDGDISAISSFLTTLSTTVDGNTTLVTQAAESIDGIEGKYGVTIDANGNITGFQLLSGTGGSAFNVRADQFAVFNNTGQGGDNPFTIFTSSRVIDGVSYPAGTYIEDAYIDNAAIVNLSVGSLKLGNNSATVADFDQYNPTINPANFIPGAGLTIPRDACTAIIQVPPLQTADIFLAFGVRHGYLSTPVQWGFRVRRNILGVSTVTLTERTGMTATNDFPVVTYLHTVTNNSSSSNMSVLIDADWYGQNSNIELQDATLSLIARYK